MHTSARVTEARLASCVCVCVCVVVCVVVCVGVQVVEWMEKKAARETDAAQEIVLQILGDLDLDR